MVSRGGITAPGVEYFRSMISPLAGAVITWRAEASADLRRSCSISASRAAVTLSWSLACWR